MALVRCAECGREISDRAPSCPHCGLPQAPVEVQEPDPRAGGPSVQAPPGVGDNGGLQPGPQLDARKGGKTKRSPILDLGIAAAVYIALAFVWPTACGVIGFLASVGFLVGALVALFRKRPARTRALLALLSLVMGITGASLDMSAKAEKNNYEKGVTALEQGDFEEAERLLVAAGEYEGAAEKLSQLRGAVDERQFKALDAKLQELGSQVDATPCGVEKQVLALIETYGQKLKSNGKFSDLGSRAEGLRDRSRAVIEAQVPDELQGIRSLVDEEKFDEARAALNQLPQCSRRSAATKRVEEQVGSYERERNDQRLFDAAIAAKNAGNIRDAVDKFGQVSSSFSRKAEADAQLTEVRAAVQLEDERKAAERARADAEATRRAEEARRAREQAAAEAERLRNLMDWEKPWSAVKGASARRCAATFPDYQLQAICMSNEKEGYGKMQGSFGLPTSVARQAKKRCQNTFPDFQLQAVCMQNEKEGYDRMKSF
jgi:hypothetical protein